MFCSLRRWAWTFYPLFPAYAGIKHQDVLCAGFTLLLCVEVFEIIDTKAAILMRPWFLAGMGLTLFVVNELRKNYFIFVVAIIVYLLIRFRRSWKRLLAPLLIFAILTGAWGLYCDKTLKASPSPTTEMLGGATDAGELHLLPGFPRRPRRTSPPRRTPISNRSARKANGPRTMMPSVWSS